VVTPGRVHRHIPREPTHLRPRSPPRDSLVVLDSRPVDRTASTDTINRPLCQPSQDHPQPSHYGATYLRVMLVERISQAGLRDSAPRQMEKQQQTARLTTKSFMKNPSKKMRG